ncbi:type IX secretion system membrane protein PorP/SprF [Marinilabiliaceae bacterium ANBcel2]|nr:type IX secretion system membrane protein PorP/SprF [Marinilabiliaceae bacterium ANBcel2]
MKLVFVTKKLSSLKLTGLSMNSDTIHYRLKKNSTLFFQFRTFWAGSFIFFALFCTKPLVHSQYDPQFSQNMFNPVVVNPGYAGNSGMVNLVALDRHQWVGIEGAPRTTVVGADMGLNLMGNSGGVGLVVMNDEIGFFRNITIQASLARQIILDEGRLGFGIGAGVVNQVFDGTKVELDPGGGGNYHSPDDPLISGVEENGTALDVGAGVYFSRKNYYGGFSVLHLFEPNPNFDDQLSVYVPRSFFLTAGYNHHLYQNPIILKPSFFLKQSGGSWQLDLNMNALFNERYWLGLTYRITDAIVLLGGVELNNGLRVGYSYDITTSGLGNAGSKGSHEIMVGYQFDISLGRGEQKYRSVRYL